MSYPARAEGVLKRRCPWCNGYRHRKWIRWHEFKSWTRLIAFHIVLIPLGKVWIQLFSLQLGVNTEFKPVKLRLQIDLVSYPARAEGVLKRRCPWCNGYRHRKWIRWHEFKSWTRLIAFHIALIPLGKVWIQLFSLQLGVNTEFKPVKLRLQIDLVSYPARAEGSGKYEIAVKINSSWTRWSCRIVNPSRKI